MRRAGRASSGGCAWPAIASSNGRTSGQLSPALRPTRNDTWLSSRRRIAKPSAAAEAPSIHCASSIAASTGPSPPERAAHPASRRRSCARPGPASAGLFVEQRDLECAPLRTGSDATACSKSPPSRSRRTENESCVSAPAGRDSSTRRSRPRASRTAALQSSVFPIPGSPTTTRTAGPATASSTKPPITASSASRSSNPGATAVRTCANPATPTIAPLYGGATEAP